MAPIGGEPRTKRRVIPGVERPAIEAHDPTRGFVALLFGNVVVSFGHVCQRCCVPALYNVQPAENLTLLAIRFQTALAMAQRADKMFFDGADRNGKPCGDLRMR